jgi:hypothetical protein
MASSIERGLQVSRIKQGDWMFDGSQLAVGRGWGYESHDGMDHSLARQVLAACSARKVGRRIEWGKGSRTRASW